MYQADIFNYGKPPGHGGERAPRLPPAMANLSPRANKCWAQTRRACDGGGAHWKESADKILNDEHAYGQGDGKEELYVFPSEP